MWVEAVTGQGITAVCAVGVIACEWAVKAGAVPWLPAFVIAAVCAFGVGRGLTKWIGSKNER